MQAVHLSAGVGGRVPGEGPERVVTVVGPEGSGKTALLDAWADRARQRVLRIDMASDQQGMNEALVRQLSPTFLDSSISAADAVMDLMGAQSTLILCDNAESLREEMWITAGTTALRLLPPNLTVVIAGRSLPPFGWSRLRLTHDLLELGPTDLRAWVEASNPDLDDDARQRVAGWAKGVALLQSADPAALDDAVRAAVDAAVDPRQRELLSVVALIGPADADLLDAAVGSSEAAALRAQLKARPVPMVDVSAGHPELIRVDGALRTILADDLRATQPELAGELLVRAADYLSRASADDRAFDLLRDSGDRARLAAFVARRGTDHVLSGRESVTEAWLSAFTEAELDSDPGLLVAASAVRAARGNFDMVDTMITRFGGDQRWAAPWAAMYSISPPPQSSEAALASYGMVDPANVPWLLLGQSLVATRELWLGHLAQAEGILTNLTTFARDYVILDAWRASNQAHLYALTGRAEKGEAVLRYAGALIDEHGLQDHPWLLPYDAADLRYATFLKDAPVVAMRIGTLSRKLERLSGRIALMRAYAHASLAMGCIFLGDLTQADTHLRSAEDLLSDEARPGQLGRELEEMRRQVSATLATSDVGITAGELRVLRALVGPETVPQIAERLFVSPATVRAQIRAIHRKLGTHGRAESVAAATRLGLLP